MRSSMVVFVPCDHKLQKAYSETAFDGELKKLKVSTTLSKKMSPNFRIMRLEFTSFSEQKSCPIGKIKLKSTT